MKQITIADTIKYKIPQTSLGVFYGKVQFEKHNPALWQDIENLISSIEKLNFEQVKQIPQIATTRAAYLKLGKEPSRYRPSAEALYRRIIKGKGLYRISNIVDAINYASLKTGYSIGGYDYAKISGDIVFDTGRSDDVYEAIGRGIINIENLPVFRDELGAFGSPTTDSVRTMITEQTREVLLIVVNFGVEQGFESDLKTVKQIMEKYCAATGVQTFVVK